jgi:hypothetical protein
MQARDANLADARRVLERAAIPFAVIEDETSARRQLGVALADKQRVITAFENHAPPAGSLAGAPWIHQVRLTKQARSRAATYLLRRRLEMSSSFVWSTSARVGRQGRIFGHEYGTVISFWATSTDRTGVARLYSSAPNRWSPVVALSAAGGGADSVPDALARSLAAKTSIDDIRFPVDLVCLWVDGSDPEWNRRRQDRLAADTGELAADATQSHLFRDREELRYALRSICEFAPFVNHVYLVTDRQTPSWLNTDVADLTVIDHSQIFASDELPIFNSNAIDTRLHRIEGLAEHFLVSNDDMLFLNPVTADDFFTPSGQPKLFLSKARIPIGPPVPGEPGVDSAAKTNRALIEAQFGLTISQKFKHIMIPQRRSLRDRVASTYRPQVDATSGHPFRELNDVSFSHLCLYDGLRTGHAVVSNLPYDYVSLGDPTFDERLTRLEASPGTVKVLCLNDGDSSGVTDVHGRPLGQLHVDPLSRDARLTRFLESVLPTPCKWELDALEDSTLINPEDPT